FVSHSGHQPKLTGQVCRMEHQSFTNRPHLRCGPLDTCHLSPEATAALPTFIFGANAGSLSGQRDRRLRLCCPRSSGVPDFASAVALSSLDERLHRCPAHQRGIRVRGASPKTLHLRRPALLSDLVSESACARLSGSSLPRFCRGFSATLTTVALDGRS